MALSLSMGSLRIAHWQATPGAASLRASAPRAATARVSLSVQAEISSRERRIRRHQSLRKKVRAPVACCLAAAAAARAPAWAAVKKRRTSASTPTLRVTQVNGSEERPRLAVFRSNQHIYAQARARPSRRAPAAARRPCTALSLAQGLELASRSLAAGD